jgi:hypothetical protein
MIRHPSGRRLHSAVKANWRSRTWPSGKLAFAAITENYVNG